MIKPKMRKQQSYLQTLDEHNRRVPMLCTVYAFEYRGIQFYVARDVNNGAYWNVYDCGTGLTIWNGFRRKTRNDAVVVFTSESNVNKFIQYIEYIKTDSYRKRENAFYIAVRAEQNRQGD